MAGYSGAPLAKKLDIKPNSSVYVLNRPCRFLELLEPIPDGVRFIPMAESIDVIVLSATSSTELEPFARLVDALEPDGALWIAWPKQHLA